MNDLSVRMNQLKRIPLEALVWSVAFVFLAIDHPGEQPHFTICPLHHLGIEFCPGCGLGRSISFLFHGNFRQSLATHPLGIFAVIVLSFRIIQLTKNYLYPYGKSY